MKKGQKMSSEQKKKISISRTGRFTGKDNSNWKGGKVLIDGYRYIYSPDHPNATKEGYVAEHRLVMEKHLGRLLNPKETIHHLNHDRLDNNIDNLHLCPSNGKHFIKFHLNKRDDRGRFKKTNNSH